ncbi:MAG: anti-sigma factor domain-containing protein [Rhodoglobus sp.]
MSTNPADDTANLSGAYALDALNANEREQLEAHLAGSEETRAEVTGLSDTAVMLGLAVTPVVPPPALKASIMAQLATTPQLAAEPPVAESPVVGKAEARARARWFTRPAVALAAAATSVALIVGGGVVSTAITSNNFAAAQAEQLAAITAADDSQRQVITLDGGGTATLVWSTELASSAVIVDGLKPLPASAVYQLWYIDAAGARSAGTFTVSAAGSTARVLEGDLKAGDTIGVTVEPRGGSTAPTTDPVVVFESA